VHQIGADQREIFPLSRSVMCDAGNRRPVCRTISWVTPSDYDYYFCCPLAEGRPMDMKNVSACADKKSR
jgi:hypothetical protein